MTKHWVRMVVKYLVLFYGQSALVINATQGIFSSQTCHSEGHVYQTNGSLRVKYTIQYNTCTEETTTTRTHTTTTMEDKHDKDDFCTEMNEKTRQVHDKSDKLINLKLAIALTDLNTYGKVLCDFYHVFQAIENGLEEAKSHPHVGPLIFKELARVERFEDDLAFYLGKDWRSNVEPSTAAQEYCDRIGQITTEDPSLLIA